jgi:hypothetical protein
VDKETPTSFQSLWQEQSVYPKQFSVEEIHATATRFQRKVRFRNLREYIPATAGLIFLAGYAWKADTWFSKAGPGLIVLGTMYLVFQLYTRAASHPVPGGQGSGDVAESCIEFHRRELERQRDMHRAIWRWYLGPLIPGLLVLFIDRFLAAWAKGGLHVAISLASAHVGVLVFIWIGRVNAVEARKLQREIDALGAASITKQA